MRIIAGRHRGARLASPAGRAIRPTSDRVREALFNILAHGLPAPGSDGAEGAGEGSSPAFTLEGARVLDLFAGTGAMGLEALSRGAAFALFVETSAEARGLIRRNIEALGLTGAARIFRRDATRLGPIGRMAPFDLVFCDPPYGAGLGERALAAAVAGGWLAPGAIVIWEESAEAGADIALPEGLAEIDRRVWGDTQAIIAARTDARYP